MKLPPLRHRFVLGALGGLLLLSGLLFDWNWARPALVHYLRHTSQRELQVDDLQVRLDSHWQPVVRLRGVRVANAPWARGDRPFAVAGEVRLTFQWTSLFDRVRMVTDMHLVDADLDLQRQADGLRNWRLTRPDDRGPARMRVLRLSAERSRLHVLHQGLGLALQVQSTPLQANEREGGRGFTQRVSFEGTLRGTPFEGQAVSGPQISLFDTGEFFALRGQARSGTTQLGLDGRAADLLQLARVEAQVQLAGDSLAALGPFVPRASVPVSKPYRFAGTVDKHGDHWAARDATLALGRSDLAGQARYTPQNERPVIEATVSSRVLHLDDLPAHAGATEDEAQAPMAAPTQRVLPQTPLRLEGLHALDGHVALHIAALHRPPWPSAHEVHADGRLDHGLLTLKLLRGGLAGGVLRGRLSLDTREAAPEVQLELDAQGLRLNALWPTLPQRDGLHWPTLQGQLALTGRGRSLAAWLGSASGRVDLALAGGSLSRKLDARLGLNALGMLGALVSGDKPVPIRCGAASIAFAHGVGRTRQLVLDTDRTHVEGQASLHLGDETWALLLTPQPQRRPSLTVPASIVAQGSFRGFRYSLSQREHVPKAERSRCGH